MRLHRSRPLTTRPTVSVVIPCYNYGRFLPTAVTSALDQDGIDLDLVVVDDASSDDSLDVARRLGEHQQVRVLEHAENRGHIATYNHGLAHVKGEYVVLLSADDVLPRNALTRAVALMEHHPQVGLVYGFPENFTGVPPRGPDRVRSWTTWSGLEWQDRICRTGRNPIMSPEVVLRRAAWDEIQEYDPRLPHAADMAVWLHTSLRWDIGRVNGPVQALYRVHGDNMHLTTYSGEKRDLAERRLAFDLLFQEGHPLPADASRRLADAHRAIELAERRLEHCRRAGRVVDILDRSRSRISGSVRYRLWRRYGL